MSALAPKSGLLQRNKMLHLRPSRLLIAAAALTAVLLAALCEVSTSVAAPAHPHHRHQRLKFTDAEIKDGFIKTAFGAEFHSAGRVDRIRKYEGPVRVWIEGSDRADRRTQIVKIIDDIKAQVQHLDIAMADQATDANVIIKLVRDRDLNRAITDLYGPEQARTIHSSLDPQCLSGFRKNDAYQIERSDVILTMDTDDFTFRDCAYEEILQSLGPINDTSSVPWTMFNDNVRTGRFGVYDQYILNMLYHPEIRAGMTIAEINAAFPRIIGDVRSWVTRRRTPKP